MEEILSAISTVGFPIVAVIAVGWFFYQFWTRNHSDMIHQMDQMAARCQAREDKLYAQLDKFSDTLNNFNMTLASIDTRLEIIEQTQIKQNKKDE